MSFPLYDRLSKNSSEKDLSLKQKKYFTESIKTIDPNGRELLYMLIKYSSLKEDNIEFDTIPYMGKSIENEKKTKNISWDLSDLPNNLKHIILNFLKMHLSKMCEEEERNLEHLV